MKAFLVKFHFNQVAALSLMALWLYTGVSKLLDQQKFTAILEQSPIIGSFAKYIAFLIPLYEILLAVILMIPVVRIYGFLLSGFLLCCFTAYIAYMLAYMPALPCSCGGVISKMSWHNHIYFNFFFILLATAGYIVDREQKLFIAINRNSRTPV